MQRVNGNYNRLNEQFPAVSRFRPRIWSLGGRNNNSQKTQPGSLLCLLHICFLSTYNLTIECWVYALSVSETVLVILHCELFDVTISEFPPTRHIVVGHVMVSYHVSFI